MASCTKISILLTIFLAFCSFMSLKSWQFMWLTATIIAGSMVIVFAIYEDDSQWLYDPFYQNWKTKTEREQMLL